MVGNEPQVVALNQQPREVKMAEYSYLDICSLSL
jgi:hypothetical protein